MLILVGCTLGCAPSDKSQASTAAQEVDEAASTAPSEGTPDPEASPPRAEDTEPALQLHPELAKYVDGVEKELDTVPEDRRKQLEKLALFIKTKRDSGEPARLTFICTHNSRRSHMSQLWATVAAAHYGVSGVETFSGGTESTAFNPRAVAALQRAGFDISAADPDAENPRYEVTFSPAGSKLEAFSKKYSEPPNPSENFAAIMTCSQADKNCPTVEGAALRVPIPYVDPKESDGTPQEAATYDARARQIATEMFYLFSKVTA